MRTQPPDGLVPRLSVAQFSQLINGYNPYGMNNLSVWAWMFLFAHLVWATGFMFLISWRGYWQELIETIVWAHERTPLANLVRWKDKPVALSIVQARVVGLAHFTVGYILTYAAFLIASTSRVDLVSGFQLWVRKYQIFGLVSSFQSRPFMLFYGKRSTGLKRMETLRVS
jgi:hypothetical protein